VEVGGAGGENHLVRLQVQPLAGQGYVDEGLVVEEVLEHGEQVVLVVVPPQAVLLGLGNRHCIGGRWAGGGVGRTSTLTG
jgi:hypothetical protein